MKNIKPVYNHGRWIVLCPKHKQSGAMPAGDEYICPACFPGIVAQMVVVRGGKIQRIPDRSAQRTARILATEKNKVFSVVFPKDKSAIEKELSKLPEDKRNWDGEKMTELKAHVKHMKHIIDNFEKRDKSLDGKNTIFIVTKGGG